MKHSIWIALPLAAALLTPVYAQQDNNSSNQTPSSAQSSSQPASQDSQATPPAQPAQNAADQGQAAHQPLQAERHEGFWGKLNPMARKKYVQRQMEPIRNRVNELDELTAANSKSIKDVDSRAQEGIRLAAARANEADQHAIDAGNRAQMADQTAQQANTRLQTVQQVVTNIDQYQPATQAEIRLRPGQVSLSKKAKEALDQMADTVKGQNAYLFEVQGFSTGQGAAAIENSQRMADSVVRYLVLNHDIPVYRIYVLGMGNAPVPATTEGGKARRVTRGGRVEVSLLKNAQLAQLASAGALPTPNANTPSQGGVSGTTTQPSQPGNYSSGSNSQQPAGNLNAPAAAPVVPPVTQQQPSPQPTPPPQR